MRYQILTISLSFAFCPFATDLAQGETFRYMGMCEASAAAVVDDTHFAVASDDSEKIRIYERGKPQPLPKPLEHAGVTDIEAAARIDGTIFWLTSHSLNKNGKDKDERKELFATSVSPGPTLVAVGSVYRNLREDIAAAIKDQDPDFIKNFNIEGMASTPAKTLLVGLRGPTNMEPGRAYVFEISNPFAILGIGDKMDLHASVAPPFHLKLFDEKEKVGRGVRSLERVGNRYLVVAGSMPDGGKPAPRLFWWDGIDENNVTPGPEVDFYGMVPEALIAWSDRSVEILGDNGDAEINGEHCDDKHDKPAGAWFPSLGVEF